MAPLYGTVPGTGGGKEWQRTTTLRDCTSRAAIIIKSFFLQTIDEEV
jgi:hypothetical protein